MSERLVGPVLSSGVLARAIAEAIVAHNPGALVEDRGAYLRVLAPSPCKVTRSAVEDALGESVRFPDDLERAMPSFKGRLVVDSVEVCWT